MNTHYQQSYQTNLPPDMSSGWNDPPAVAGAAHSNRVDQMRKLRLVDPSIQQPGYARPYGAPPQHAGNPYGGSHQSQPYGAPPQSMQQTYQSQGQGYSMGQVNTNMYGNQQYSPYGMSQQTPYGAPPQQQHSPEPRILNNQPQYHVQQPSPPGPYGAPPQNVARYIVSQQPQPYGAPPQGQGDPVGQVNPNVYDNQQYNPYGVQQQTPYGAPPQLSPQQRM